MIKEKVLEDLSILREVFMKECGSKTKKKVLEK